MIDIFFGSSVGTCLITCCRHVHVWAKVLYERIHVLQIQAPWKRFCSTACRTALVYSLSTSVRGGVWTWLMSGVFYEICALMVVISERYCLCHQTLWEHNNCVPCRTREPVSGRCFKPEAYASTCVMAKLMTWFARRRGNLWGYVLPLWCMELLEWKQ